MASLDSYPRIQSTKIDTLSTFILSSVCVFIPRGFWLIAGCGDRCSMLQSWAEWLVAPIVNVFVQMTAPTSWKVFECSPIAKCKTIWFYATIELIEFHNKIIKSTLIILVNWQHNHVKTNITDVSRKYPIS